MEQYEYSIVATSGRLTDEQYAERIRIDPPPETEVRDFRSDKGIGPQLKLRFN